MDPIDLSSGTLQFGNTCPGSFMQRLRIEHRGQIRKVKKLQTAFSRHSEVWGCPIGAEDANEVVWFIKAIPSLEDLDIYNFEQHFDVLWPAIFHHAASLKSLAIHSPPQYVPSPGAIWTAEAVKRVADGLPRLKHLEIDIETDTAKAAVKNITAGSVLDEVAKMSQLESLRVSVVLLDTESVFAGDNRPNAFGSQMPDPKDAVCIDLARKIFNKFYENDAGAALTQVELRMTRRWWEDRGQFRTGKFSYLAVKDDAAGPSGETASAEEKEEVPSLGRYNLRRRSAPAPAPDPVPQPQNSQTDVTVTAEGPWRGYAPVWSSNLDKPMRELFARMYSKSIPFDPSECGVPFC